MVISQDRVGWHGGLTDQHTHVNQSWIHVPDMLGLTMCEADHV